MRVLIILVLKIQISILMNIEISEIDNFIDNVLLPAKNKLDKGFAKPSDYSVSLINALFCLEQIDNLK